MLCLCGCGLEAKENRIFCNGHNRRNVKLEKETKRKMSLAKKGIKLNRHPNNFVYNKPKVTCNICGKTTEVIPSQKNKKYCSRKCKRLGMMKTYDILYGADKSKSVRQKQSKKCAERWKNDSFKKNQSNKMIEKWKNPEYANKIKINSIKNWQNPEYAKKVMKRRKMSEPEKEFQSIIDENNFPFYFNGTLSLKGRELTINRKVPDFVHKTEPKLIEIYGDYFHKGQNPQDRIDFFKERGYDCIIFWASELKKENNVVGEIKNFLEHKKC